MIISKIHSLIFGKDLEVLYLYSSQSISYNENKELQSLKQK